MGRFDDIKPRRYRTARSSERVITGETRLLPQAVPYRFLLPAYRTLPADSVLISRLKMG
jgi:hypothetical protein